MPKRMIPLASALFFAGTASFCDGHAPSPTEAKVVVTNTRKGACTKNAQIDVAVFGLLNDCHATSGEAVEVPDLSRHYSFGIDEDRIAFA